MYIAISYRILKYLCVTFLVKCVEKKSKEITIFISSKTCSIPPPLIRRIGEYGILGEFPGYAPLPVRVVYTPDSYYVREFTNNFCHCPPHV